LLKYFGFLFRSSGEKKWNKKHLHNSEYANESAVKIVLAELNELLHLADGQETWLQQESCLRKQWKRFDRILSGG